MAGWGRQQGVSGASSIPTSGSSGSPGWRPRLGVPEWVLLALAPVVLLVVSPLGQIVALVCLLSFIGIPLYFVMAALPAGFLIGLFVVAGLWAWRSLRAGSLLYSALFAAVLALMADFFVIGAWRENMRLDGRAAMLHAGDRDQPVAIPGTFGALAIVRNSRAARDRENACDDICQRLLLNGQVRSVLSITLAPPVAASSGAKGRRKLPVPVSEADWPALEPDAQEQGIMYWLERRANCGEARIPEQLRLLNLPSRETPQRGIVRQTPVRAAEAMRLRIAGGECLMSRNATLAEADAVLAYGTVASGQSAYGAAHDAHANTISAWRLAFMQRTGAAMVENYRATGVSYQRFPHARIPTYIHGYQFAMKTGWLRMPVLLGDRTRFQERPALEAFVSDRLSLKLYLDEAAGPAGGADALDRILASQGALSALDAKIVHDFAGYINTAAGNAAFALTRGDAERLLRIAADRRIELPWTIAGAAAAIAKHHPGLAPALAERLFARIAASPAQEPVEGSGKWRDALRSVASALARLPDRYLLAHRAAMESLARDRARREPVERLLQRLDVFGPDIVPLLFEVMDDSIAQRAGATNRREARAQARNWNSGYWTAVGGLCRLGNRAAFALPLLRQRIEAERKAQAPANDGKLIVALARLGAAENQVREIMNIDPADEKAEKRFHFAWRSALRDNACQ